MRYRDFVEETLQHDQLMGIPYVANDVAAYRAMLALDAHEVLLGIDNTIRELSAQIQSHCEVRMTNTRLKNMRDAFTVQKRKLAPMFRSLGTDHTPFSEPNHYLARRKNGQLLMEGYSYIFRDWSWGEREIQAYLEIIQRNAKELRAERVVTLGAGACRLPYEIHQWLQPKYSLCIDMNPFPLYCADRVLKGEKLELVEVPIVPIDINSFTKVTQVAHAGRVSLAADAFEMLVHDLTEWGLRPESFDCVVTPWFIDVSSMRPHDLFARINRTLPVGGSWINFGPVGFVNNVLKYYYSKEEIIAIVKKSGFEIVSESFEPVPYLQNPSSGHWRTEHAHCFWAKKVAIAPSAGDRPDDKMPEWVENPSLSVQLDLPADEMIRSFEFACAVLRGVQDGKSIKDLAERAHRDFAVPSELAEYLVTGMLVQWQSGLRYNPMKE